MEKNLRDRTDFTTCPLYDLPGMRINIPKLTNKKIYEILTFSKAIPSAENKWIEYFPFLETINWSDIYSLCSLVTTNSKLRSLQYNIVHRIFCCNYNLYLWKIVEKSECWYCNEVDTLEHYFFSCEQRKIMWKEVEKIIHNTLGLKISFTVLEVLLGIPCKNICFTMFKSPPIIYKTIYLLTEKQLNAMFPRFLFSSLKQKKIEIEIYLLKSNSKTSDSFLKEWEKVLAYMISILQ